MPRPVVSVDARQMPIPPRLFGFRKSEPQVLTAPPACVLWGRVAQRGRARVSGSFGFWPVRISRMFDAATARRHMVDGQIRTADVTNLRLIAAMETVPREAFVAPPLTAQAYCDGDIALCKGRALLRPMVLAKLIQGVGLRAGEHVLD